MQLALYDICHSRVEMSSFGTEEVHHRRRDGFEAEDGDNHREPLGRGVREPRRQPMRTPMVWRSWAGTCWTIRLRHAATSAK